MKMSSTFLIDEEFIEGNGLENPWTDLFDRFEMKPITCDRGVMEEPDDWAPSTVDVKIDVFEVTVYRVAQ